MLLLPALAVVLINVGNLWTPPVAVGLRMISQILPYYSYSSYYYRSTYYTTRVSYSRYRYSTMNRLKKYSRVYSSIRLVQPFYYYHRFYPYVARLYSFRAQTSYSSFRKCANFETSIYGDFIGYFSCPQFFEPRNYTYCCGTTSYNYCCSVKSSSNPYNPSSSSGSSSGSVVGATIILSTPVIIGISSGTILMGIGITIFLIFCCCAKATTRARVNPWATATVVTTTNTSRAGAVTVVQQQHQQQLAAYPNPAYAGVPPPYPGPPPGYPVQPAPAAYPGQPMSAAYPGQTMAPVPAPAPAPAFTYNAPATYPPTQDPVYPPPDPNKPM